MYQYAGQSILETANAVQSLANITFNFDRQDRNYYRYQSYSPGNNSRNLLHGKYFSDSYQELNQPISPPKRHQSKSRRPRLIAKGGYSFRKKRSMLKRFLGSLSERAFGFLMRRKSDKTADAPTTEGTSSAQLQISSITAPTPDIPIKPQTTDSSSATAITVNEKCDDESKKEVKRSLCEHCGKCKHKFQYRLHLRMHTGKQPYQCDQCEKFTTKQSLETHCRTHTTYKRHRFQCIRCGKTFSRKVELNDHRFSHTGEQPHRCDQCSKTFFSRCSLKKHQRLAHSVERAATTATPEPTPAYLQQMTTTTAAIASMFQEHQQNICESLQVENEVEIAAAADDDDDSRADSSGQNEEEESGKRGAKHHQCELNGKQFRHQVHTCNHEPDALRQAVEQVVPDQSAEQLSEKEFFEPSLLARLLNLKSLIRYTIDETSENPKRQLPQFQPIAVPKLASLFPRNRLLLPLTTTIEMVVDDTDEDEEEDAAATKRFVKVPDILDKRVDELIDKLPPFTSGMLPSKTRPFHESVEDDNELHFDSNHLQAFKRSGEEDDTSQQTTISKAIESPSKHSRLRARKPKRSIKETTNPETDKKETVKKTAAFQYSTKILSSVLFKLKTLTISSWENVVYNFIPAGEAAGNERSMPAKQSEYFICKNQTLSSSSSFSQTSNNVLIDKEFYHGLQTKQHLVICTNCDEYFTETKQIIYHIFQLKHVIVRQKVDEEEEDEGDDDDDAEEAEDEIENEQNEQSAIFTDIDKTDLPPIPQTPNQVENCNFLQQESQQLQPAEIATNQNIGFYAGVENCSPLYSQLTPEQSSIEELLNDNGSPQQFQSTEITSDQTLDCLLDNQNLTLAASPSNTENMIIIGGQMIPARFIIPPETAIQFSEQSMKTFVKQITGAQFSIIDSTTIIYERDGTTLINVDGR